MLLLGRVLQYMTMVFLHDWDEQGPEKCCDAEVVLIEDAGDRIAASHICTRVVDRCLDSHCILDDLCEEGVLVELASRELRK